jgi:hypothetical protein
MRKRVWLSLSESEWAVLEHQTKLGRYRTIGDCASAELSRYQESWSQHLEYPSIQQLLAQPSPRVTQGSHRPTQAVPGQVKSIPLQVQPAPINPNNPNGF